MSNFFLFLRAILHLLSPEEELKKRFKEDPHNALREIRRRKYETSHMGITHANEASHLQIDATLEGKNRLNEGFGKFMSAEHGAGTHITVDNLYKLPGTAVFIPLSKALSIECVIKARLKAGYINTETTGTTLKFFVKQSDVEKISNKPEVPDYPHMKFEDEKIVSIDTFKGHISTEGGTLTSFPIGRFLAEDEPKTFMGVPILLENYGIKMTDLLNQKVLVRVTPDPECTNQC